MPERLATLKYFQILQLYIINNVHIRSSHFVGGCPIGKFTVINQQWGESGDHRSHSVCITLLLHASAKVGGGYLNCHSNSTA